MTAPQQCESAKRSLRDGFPPGHHVSLHVDCSGRSPAPPGGASSFLRRPVALGRKHHVLGAEHARTTMLIAELGLAAAPERVAIRDRAVEIDRGRAELDLAHLLFGERRGQARLDGESVAAWI